MNYKDRAKDLIENRGQWKAYESTGNCVILAGPGSGKTKTLTTKMARMLSEDVSYPSGIACVTYSAECARELQRRLSQLGVVESSNIFIGTVHSFSLKHVIAPFSHLSDLKFPEKINVATVSEQEKFFEEALKWTIGDENPFRYKTRFDRYRRTFLDRESKAFQNKDSQMASLIRRYEDILLREGLFDFDGMILGGLRLIERHEWIRKAIKAKFPILVVDEYQDLGLPLHRIVLSLCQKAGIRLLAVGDPDQSIYGFAGSMPALLQELAKEKWIEPVLLKFNYRCGRKIVAASITALGEDREYESKSDEHGTIDFYECTEGIEQQANLIINEIVPLVLKQDPRLKLGDIAVLYTDRNDGGIIAKAAEVEGMQFVRLDAGAPYRRTPLTRWLEDCAAWCSGGWAGKESRLSEIIKRWLRLNRSVRSDLEQSKLRASLVKFLFSHRDPDLPLRAWLQDCYNCGLSIALKTEPTLRDEREAFNALARASAPDQPLGEFTIANFSGQGGSPEHLNLITLHSAKGLEFEVVIMMGMDQGKLPRWDVATPEGISEARRLFYVGLTRAKKQVHMTFSGFTEDQYGRKRYNGRSKFLQELEDKIADDGTD